MKIAESNRGKVVSEEWKSNHSKTMKENGIRKKNEMLENHSEEVKKLSHNKLNTSDIMKETGLSRNHVNQILDYLGLYTKHNKGNRKSKTKGRPRNAVTCPHCGKSGGEPQMIQWHFDKCKLYDSSCASL